MPIGMGMGSGIKSYRSEMEGYQNPHHDHSEENINDLQGRVKKLEIITQAMWEVVQDTGVPIEKLYAKIDELVLDPGRKVKPAYENIHIVNCPRCGKAIQESKATPMLGRCMFCGEKIVFYPYSENTANAQEKAEGYDGENNLNG